MARDDDEAGSGSRLRGVAGLGLIIVLVLGVLFVMQQLRHAASIQDCVASGRSNCAPISQQGSGR